MVRWRRRASSARYGVGATALTLRRLELAGWSSGGIGLVAARASRARGSEKEVVNEVPPLPLPTATICRIPGSFSLPAAGWGDAPGA